MEVFESILDVQMVVDVQVAIPSRKCLAGPRLPEAEPLKFDQVRSMREAFHHLALRIEIY